MSEFDGFHVWWGLGSSRDWHSGLNVARCRATKVHRADHDQDALRIPVPDCGCGFWYYREFEALLEEFFGPASYGGGKLSGSRGMWGFSPEDALEGPVIGRVRGFGKVIEGKLGFRAEKARVVELYEESHPATALDLAERFEVPLKPYPWPTATGLVSIQERPGLHSAVTLWTGEQTSTFFERPTSDIHATLVEAATLNAMVTVTYRQHLVGNSPSLRIVRVAYAGTSREGPLAPWD